VLSASNNSVIAKSLVQTSSSHQDLHSRFHVGVPGLGLPFWLIARMIFMKFKSDLTAPLFKILLWFFNPKHSVQGPPMPWLLLSQYLCLVMVLSKHTLPLAPPGPCSYCSCCLGGSSIFSRRIDLTRASRTTFDGFFKCS
jgi:hypothetical protein